MSLLILFLIILFVLKSSPLTLSSGNFGNLHPICYKSFLPNSLMMKYIYKLILTNLILTFNAMSVMIKRMNIDIALGQPIKSNAYSGIDPITKDFR